MTGRLQGRRVLVTGAGSGIGLAAVRLLAQEGARLALVARGTAGLEAAAAQAHARGAEAHVVPADVADPRAVQPAVRAAVAELGGLDLLVVGAAAASYGPLRDVSGDDLRRTLAVTFTGALETVLAALPELERSGGRVIVLGSAAARMPLPLLGPYAAAKHALRGALGTLRAELLAEGSSVRITMIHPGPVRTPFWRHVTSSTGRLPPAPPVAADPGRVAAEIVRAAVAGRPRREVPVGPGARLGPAAAAVARPLLDHVLAVVPRVALGRGRPASGAGGLRTATGAGETT